MPGEYSHEFSAKVLTRPSRLIELGFWQGGPADTGGLTLEDDELLSQTQVLRH